MHRLQNEITTIKKIQDLWELYYVPELMNGAFKIGLFNYLEQYTDADELANNLNQDPKIIKVLLDSLSLMDLIEKKDSLYKNTPDSSSLFVEGKADYLKTLISEWKDNADDSFLNILEILDQPDYRKYQTEKLNKCINNKTVKKSEKKLSLADIAPIIYEKISNLPDYYSFTRMLDIGGAPGFFSFYFVLNHPVMKGIILEREQAAKAVCKFIHFYGINDRLTTLPADLIFDPIGDGYDFIWAGPVSDYLISNFDLALTKIYNSLKPGGIFTILHDGLLDEGTKPDMTFSYKHYSLPSNNGSFNGANEIPRLMKIYGFKQVRSTFINSPMDDLELYIGMKNMG